MESWQADDTAPFGIGDEQMDVLVVDDEKAVAELTATFVGRELESAETTTLTDATAVLEELADEEYDCIVSDYDMPTLDGLELLEELRTAGVSIPFILFTGKGSEEIASRAISAGVSEYLQKGGPDVYPVLANQVETLVEKHRAEKQAQRNFLAIESAHDGIGIVDEEGVYRYMNDAYADVYDRNRAELVGSHWEMLYPDEERQRFHDEILPQLTEQGMWQGVSTGLTRDGEEVREQLVLTQMEDGGHICIVRDLTEKHERVANLSLKNRVLDSMSAGVTVIDSSQDDNPLVYVNEGFERLTGYDAEDVVGEHCGFLFGPQTDPETTARVRAAIEDEKPVSTELRTYRNNGEHFWNFLELTPVEDDNGTTTHLVGVHRDITRWKSS